jgi:CheY-like chemotaxis protein
LNSRDSMPDGGTIIIHAANIALSDRETAKGWITDTASASRYGIDSGNYIVLSVSDTGTGMTPNVLTRAFDPFFTTKPLGQGTGLGLSMTFGFVKQSGGHINLESDVGQGTKVTIYLPQYREEATDDSLSLQREGGLAMAERPVILLVEDEPDLRMLLAEMLSDLNYTVLEADAGRSGLNLLETSKRIDLLVTDVGLPGGMNGRQLADAAREQRPELKVLFVTGFDATAGVAKTLLNDGMEVMTKPFAMSAFQTKIEGMMVEYLH